ncbi:5'/3'-nucleotidase SurE [Sphingobium sp. DEHP117]|uniref:5'/3'-nucleotidase SurE n=1 Tax=Sphingobium sp. DEHP117 TaxID=2993436 RepID=UPI0027D55F6F|nr:5'/3'-nucleotidase SurE [Sphingobium sp. DEHP117]MDQ4419365.1 5'/3'-nucleotidase SurE [Sphingobium sp. DEHP117]
MRILLTNDDGVHAPGLEVLLKIARAISDDIWIVAPSEEQSGTGHSLTLTRPLRIRKHGHQHYSVTGTPTDAVMMAVSHLMKDCKPDLVLSGVNRGANLGEHVTYSGTVSAAMEGAISGIRSIALSQVYRKEGMGDEVPFGCAAVWGERVVRALLKAPPGEQMLVNVNFPAIDPSEVQGIRVARQGFHDTGLARVIEGKDPRGYRYYWFGLDTSEAEQPGTDLEAINAGYISVTPLHYDLTHDGSMAGLSKLFV